MPNHDMWARSPLFGYRLKAAVCPREKIGLDETLEIRKQRWRRYGVTHL
jgi:hypothetical protein